MASEASKRQKETFYPSPAIKQKLENYSIQKNMSKSAVIKEALRQFFTPKEATIRR